MLEPSLEQKVDRILLLLEGSAHQPGIAQRMDVMEGVVNGRPDGPMGVVTKVNIMWRAHIWIVGALGTLVGAALTFGLQHVK